VTVRRRFLALVATMGLAFLASVLLIERWTRPAARGSPAASIPPPQVHRVPAAATVAPEPAAARAVPSARARRPAPPPVPVGAGPRVEFSFKLDPRLTSGLHMGNRWVSPRTYTRTGDAKNVTVEARARVVDARSKASPAKVAWAASEPDMVEVSPEHGDEVELTVWRAGESKVTVRGGGASGTLTVRASEARGALRVEIVR
jgi:hypothetical protein